jgi:murein DD-endopeptidase MepM/ murein hydrolase activator NlpD
MDKNTNGGVCMDKKANNKTLNFFKKEGFYVILFVCLCIVATVATITTNNNKKQSSKQQANAGDVLKEQEKEYQGALQVKEKDAAKTTVLKAVPNIKKVTTDNLTATAPVSKVADAKFEKPVANGLLARAYSRDIDTVRFETEPTYRTNLGIDIQAKLGEPVVAVMDGVVKEVGTDVEDQKGKMVLIDHQNGLFTKYSNLDEKILVKKGDKVTKKQQIAIVGNTSLNSYKEVYGSHLHFQVLKLKKAESTKVNQTKYESIDPTRYVKYDKYQTKEVKQ